MASLFSETVIRLLRKKLMRFGACTPIVLQDDRNAPGFHRRVLSAVTRVTLVVMTGEQVKWQGWQSGDGIWQGNVASGMALNSSTDGRA